MARNYRQDWDDEVRIARDFALFAWGMVCGAIAWTGVWMLTWWKAACLPVERSR